ncbi:hypothetical protein [Pseudonocardia sp.]|jgi:hypothetical protein|uniref:hypothetical protein n=1 Tax=Pseudonocardia sp. TaxID=60912 RepID=UPI0031FC8513
MTGTTSLGGIVADRVNAMNACDEDALVGAFAHHRRRAAAGQSPKPATTAEGCRRGRRR